MNTNTFSLSVPTRGIQLSALLMGIALLVLGNGLQGTLLGVRAGLEGMVAETIGMFMTAYFVGYAVGSVIASRIVERVGHIRTFAALASVASAVALAYALAITPIVWVVLRFIHGACYAGLIVVSESWLNACTDRAHRGRILAVYSIVLYVAWIASQSLLNLATPSGFVLFCIVSICLSLALVPVTLSRASVPGVVRASRSRLKRLFEISPISVVGTFFVAMAMSAFWGMAPTFAQSIGFDNKGISMFMAVAMGGALTLQWPLGWLSDYVDRRRVIVLSCFGAAFTSVALVFSAEQSLWVLLVLSFLFGGLSFPLYSLFVAHANDQVDRVEVVAVASGLTLVFGCGAALGPVAASIIMGQIGHSGLFAFSSAVLFFYGAYGLLRITQKVPIAAELKGTFVAMPGTSHASAPLHKHGSGEAPGAKAPD